MRLSLTELVSFLNADLRSDLNASLSGPTDRAVAGVSVDSRSVGAGELFVPLVAERDGHDFLPGAIEAGAAAVMTGRQGQGSVVAAANPGVAVLEVADTDLALAAIGRFARTRLPGPVVGVTGSVGKTSVKDLALAACAGSVRTWASEKSFNNEIGVPLTLANAPDDTSIAIVEMGARGVGHIAELCDIARPTVGVVTRVAMAHSELFGSIETVAEAKGELIATLGPDGTAVLNADDPLVAAMASLASGRVLTFGSQGTVAVAHIELDTDLRPSFDLSFEGQVERVRLSVRGEHMVLNAAGAVAAAIGAGIDFAEAAAGVAEASLSPWRMEVSTSSSGLTVINDAYNANPTSMRAAISSLLSLSSSRGIKTPVAVLGLMAELGDEGQGEHEAVAREAAEAGVRVIAVDASVYGQAAEHVTSLDEAFDRVDALGGEGVVLVKGSRVAELERLAERLLA